MPVFICHRSLEDLTPNEELNDSNDANSDIGVDSSHKEISQHLLNNFAQDLGLSKRLQNLFQD